jgi:hypothetical protein
MGIPVNEDLATLLLVSEMVKGSSEPYELTKYRKWSEQEVSAAHYPRIKRLSFEAIEVLLNARRAGLRRAAIVAPIPGGPFGLDEVESQ